MPISEQAKENPADQQANKLTSQQLNRLISQPAEPIRNDIVEHVHLGRGQHVNSKPTNLDQKHDNQPTSQKAITEQQTSR